MNAEQFVEWARQYVETLDETGQDWEGIDDYTRGVNSGFRGVAWDIRKHLPKPPRSEMLNDPNVYAVRIDDARTYVRREKSADYPWANVDSLYRVSTSQLAEYIDQYENRPVKFYRLEEM